MGAGNALDNYTCVGELGRGAYGCVYKGVHMQTRKEYAIKKTHIDNKNDGIPATTIREIAILMELQHENIVALEDNVMLENDIFFIQEYCNTDLAKFMHAYSEEGRLLPADLIKSYMR